MSEPPTPPAGQSCTTCYYGREMTFSLPSSGLLGGTREDQTLLVCAWSSPILTADLRVLEARWPQVRPDYWCGEWSATAVAPV